MVLVIGIRHAGFEKNPGVCPGFARIEVAFAVVPDRKPQDYSGDVGNRNRGNEAAEPKDMASNFHCGQSCTIATVEDKTRAVNDPT
jgi:hypothetical protein